MIHTLILETPKLEIAENPNVIELVTDLINKQLVNLHYFGVELDNQVDYADDDMIAKIDSTSFITIHFDEDVETVINYDIEEQSAFKLFHSILMDNKIGQITSDGKDLEIYIY